MDSKFKILFITDSLGFPRDAPEMVMYENTYISLLKDQFKDCDIIHQGRGGSTVVDLYNHTSYFHFTLQPDMVFIQSGIVDCAPRALTLIEQYIISRIPLVNKLLEKIIKKNSAFLRRTRKITYTSPNTFQTYINKFNTLFPNTYWIGILPAVDNYEKKISGIKIRIESYNSILIQSNSNSNYICVNDFIETDMMSDFHHLNQNGHRKLFEKLSDIINKKLLK